MKKISIIAIILPLILVACPNGPLPLVEGLPYCQSAENHLKELGCIPKDQPYTANGKSFSEFCQATLKNGINIYPKCIARITACNQINACVPVK